MIYIIFIINHVYYLMNEFKMLIFTYNNDQKVYILPTQFYSLRSYLQETINFLDTFNNLCI